MAGIEDTSQETGILSSIYLKSPHFLANAVNATSATMLMPNIESRCWNSVCYYYNAALTMLHTNAILASLIEQQLAAQTDVCVFLSRSCQGSHIHDM